MSQHRIESFEKPARNAKVVVFGKSESGKSALVNKLIPDAFNIEHTGHPVAMDYGAVSFQGIHFHLFGTPGKVRFKSVRESLSRGADAVIFVLDSSSNFEEDDQTLLYEVEHLHIPYIVFINRKQSTEWEYEYLDECMVNSLTAFQIIEGSATTSEWVYELLIALKQMIELRCTGHQVSYA
jgi:small GTP-binding protein